MGTIIITNKYEMIVPAPQASPTSRMGFIDTTKKDEKPTAVVTAVKKQGQVD